MSKNNDKKTKLLAAMADHVLHHGLNTASLRPLANAAGTSDRMLIYHFKTKDQLIEALLAYLAETLMTKMTHALPPQRAPNRAACVEEIVALMRSPDVAGFVRIWFDILSSAAQGKESHAAIAKDIMTGFAAWLESRLPEDEKNPTATAQGLLTLVEGIIMLDTAGHHAYSDAAIRLLLKDGHD